MATQLLLFLSCALAHTVTLLFSDARYADMTLAVANDSFRLARRSPYNFTDNLRLTIFAAVDVDCARFKPFDCVATRRSYANFQDFLQLRVETLRALLEYPPRGVTGYLMLDSDVVLRRNVADRIGSSATADVVFQREVPCTSPPCVNGGVWWARVGSTAVHAFLRAAAHYMKSLHLPDQDAFDAALATSVRHGLRVEYLPTERYPNGFVLEANDRLAAPRIHLAHSNWCQFVQKRPRLDQVARARDTLPTPVATNQTFVCAQLRELDLLNLSLIFGCSGARACRKRVSDRCATLYSVSPSLVRLNHQAKQHFKQAHPNG